MSPRVVAEEHIQVGGRSSKSVPPQKRSSRRACSASPHAAATNRIRHNGVACATTLSHTMRGEERRRERRKKLGDL